MAHDPNKPIVSNPNPILDMRGLLERLEARSTGAHQASAKAAVAHSAEVLEWLGPQIADHIAELGELAADVRLMLANMKAEATRKALADNAVITFVYDKSSDYIRVTSSSGALADNPVVIYPHQELVVRADSRKVAVDLVNVRPRAFSRSVPLGSLYSKTIVDQPIDETTPTGFEALLGGGDGMADANAPQAKQAGDDAAGSVARDDGERGSAGQ